MKYILEGNNVKRSARGMMSALLLLLVVCMPLAAFAVSYPAPLYHREVRYEKFVKGDTLYMFHSGTEDVKKTIHVNDTLAVYRVTSTCEVVKVGIVKIVSFTAGTYLKGEVFAGEIKPDDIVKKGNVSCLIISAGVCEH
jgi:hypothetical protein